MYRAADDAFLWIDFEFCSFCEGHQPGEFDALAQGEFKEFDSLCSEFETSADEDENAAPAVAERTGIIKMREEHIEDTLL